MSAIAEGIAATRAIAVAADKRLLRIVFLP